MTKLVDSVTSNGSWSAYGAAGWAAIFAVLHVIWAMGIPIGLNAEAMREAFRRPWFLAYDLAVAATCVLAVGIALAQVRPRGRQLSRSAISALGWSGTGLLVLRGGAGITQIVYYAATGRNVIVMAMFWEMWFCVGAVLFAMSAWRYRRTSCAP